MMLAEIAREHNAELVRERLKDLVEVNAKKTSIICPICGMLIERTGRGSIQMQEVWIRI